MFTAIIHATIYSCQSLNMICTYTIYHTLDDDAQCHNYLYRLVLLFNKYLLVIHTIISPRTSNER